VMSQVMIGRAFFEKGSFAQASEVLHEALDHYEAEGDDLSKRMMYWLGRAYEAGGRTEEARSVYGKLMRADYNYANGDVRKRHEALK
jgi:hypothetical protein